MLEIVRRINMYIPAKLILIGGSVNDNALAEARETGDWDFVDYRGCLSQEDAFDIVSKSDFGLVTLLDVADYKYTNPNKIYEYMMLGTPFIATDFFKWKQQLECVNAGFFLNIDSIIDNVIELLIESVTDEKKYQELANNGIEYIKNKFNWNLIEEPKLLALYERIQE